MGTHNETDEKKDFVRIKVKKYGMQEPQLKRFSIDPDLTSYKTLRELLTKAFDLQKADFVISYLIPRRRAWEEDRFLPMLSDWDLNTAIYGASNPQLVLKVDMKPFEEGLEEWDIIEPDDFALKSDESNFNKKNLNPLNWLAVGKSKLAAKSGLLSGDNNAKTSPVLSDAEWMTYMDSQGRILNSERLRLRIYASGVEPSLRPVIWRQLLNVYPANLTGEERIAYTKSLAEKYYCLKECWQKQLRSGRATDELRMLANAVRKDVVRTDRCHDFFYAPEGEENKNVLALFNVLTTFALCHPDVTYCQGMSDLASPLLVVMQDEAQAYICFCALMTRLRSSFLCDGKAMTVKFRHLSELLQHSDPVFYEYLREMHAEDLLFCYRWLLLELKREFNFEDSLRVLEVMWASLPPEPAPSPTLPIFEFDLTATDDIPFSPSLTVPVGQNRALKLLNITSDRGKKNNQFSGKGSMSPDSSIGATSSSTLEPQATNRNQGTISQASGSSVFFEENNMSLDAFDTDFDISNVEMYHRDRNGKLHNHTKKTEEISKNIIKASLDSNKENSLAHQYQKQFSNESEAPTISPKDEHEVMTPLKTKRIDSLAAFKSSVIASSCPGNLSGLCHPSLLRSLMLGRSSETKIHSCSYSTGPASNLSYPPKRFRNETSSKNRRCSESWSPYRYDHAISAPKNINGYRSSSTNNTFTETLINGEFEEAAPKLSFTLESNLEEHEESSVEAHGQPASISVDCEVESKHLHGDPISPQSDCDLLNEEILFESSHDDNTRDSSKLCHRNSIDNPTLHFEVPAHHNDQHDSAESYGRSPNSNRHYSTSEDRSEFHNHHASRRLSEGDLTGSCMMDGLVLSSRLSDFFQPLSDRMIRASTETSVADCEEEQGDLNSNGDQYDSPVPVATEASTMELDLNMGELTLAEIEDICVTQATVNSRATPGGTLSSSASPRSRQTSGDRSTHNGTDSKERTRHPTNSQNGATLPDSGYSCGGTASGVTTPYTNSIGMADTTLSERLPPSSQSAPISVGGSKKSYSVGAGLGDSESNMPTEFVNVENPTNFLLPSPADFGDGNPFLMFVCLTLLIEHRDRIMKQQMDFNEIAIYFDKLARKHSAERILQRARILYSSYLRSGWFREARE